MAIQLPSLTSLRAFEAAARLSSFKQAAAELCVTATAISHRIRNLEEYLACPLFFRKVRQVELTPNGLILFSAVNSSFGNIALAIEQLRKPLRTAVTLSVTPAFASKWLVPRLATFQHEYPNIDLHIHASNSPVDVNKETVDLAIRYGFAHDKDGHSTLLLADEFAPVASPRLQILSSQDSAQWPLIHFDWQRAVGVDLTWAAWFRLSGKQSNKAAYGIRYSEEIHAIQAAVAAQGVALLSLLLVEQELRLGLLQIVAESRLKGMSYYLLKSNQQPLSAAGLIVEAWLLRIAHEHPSTAL